MSDIKIPHVWEAIPPTHGVKFTTMYKCICCDKETHIGLDIDYEAHVCDLDHAADKIRELKKLLERQKIRLNDLNKAVDEKDVKEAYEEITDIDVFNWWIKNKKGYHSFNEFIVVTEVKTWEKGV